MSEVENILKTKPFRCSVSSVLNKDVKQHGKSFLFDGLDDTAWYSDQGLPQNITIGFNEPIETVDLTANSRLEIKFQGGFVGSVFHLRLDNANGEHVYRESFYPDDINDMQIFRLGNKSTNDVNELKNIKKVNILFEKSSDFFGRIIIYNLEMYV